MNDANQQDDSADQHHHSLERVVEDAGTKTAERGIERDTHAKNQQTGFVGNTRCGFQQPRPADELHRHCPDKRHQKAQAREPDQQTALVAGKEHIVQGYGIIAARQNGEFLTQNPQRKPDRRKLDHRQKHPAEAIFIGRAGAAYKRTGADIGSGKRHG